MTLQPYQKDWAMQSQLTEISNEDMKRRRKFYLQCFDDLTGNAAGKYINTIISVIIPLPNILVVNIVIFLRRIDRCIFGIGIGVWTFG